MANRSYIDGKKRPEDASPYDANMTDLVRKDVRKRSVVEMP